ncbi:hypothetical protein M422DRAFT_267443 [Sphaerobolus stellatus SS14]|uniref:PBP domain-containing protein n=1 Tax=Sphaerobolus stellatus (strain SS14) TaxID=990650 RepID=A0A0C9V0M2_SPHS4|nr:hypothetical protein M422DRAFT_267443 [Sphaerobolus stellatus SS14]
MDENLFVEKLLRLSFIAGGHLHLPPVNFQPLCSNADNIFGQAPPCRIKTLLSSYRLSTQQVKLVLNPKVETSASLISARMSLFIQPKTLATAQFREITGNFIPTLLTSSRPHIIPSTYLDKFGLPTDHPHGIPIPDGHYAEHAAPPGSMLLPQEVYHGSKMVKDAPMKLRIANGAAGQSGPIRELAQFLSIIVGWYLGDTTQSLAFLSAESIDIALTYHPAAEKRCKASASFAQDHFCLVGPKSKPAELNPRDDTVLDMFSKIVEKGNEDDVVPPKTRPPVRFLSRYDKSATNIKESEIFIQIGQVSWALAYSKWYHQYPRFPLQSLSGASALEEYMFIDRGAWLSSPQSVTDRMTVYKKAEQFAGDDDLLLLPCHACLGELQKTRLSQKWGDVIYAD